MAVQARAEGETLLNALVRELREGVSIALYYRELELIRKWEPVLDPAEYPPIRTLPHFDRDNPYPEPSNNTPEKRVGVESTPDPHDSEWDSEGDLKKELKAISDKSMIHQYWRMRKNGPAPSPSVDMSGSIIERTRALGYTQPFLTYYMREVAYARKRSLKTGLTIRETRHADQENMIKSRHWLQYIEEMGSRRLGKQDDELRPILFRGFPLVEEVVFIKHPNFWLADAERNRPEIPLNNSFWTALALLFYGRPWYWLRIKAMHCAVLEAVLAFGEPHPCYKAYSALNEEVTDVPAEGRSQANGKTRRIPLTLNWWEKLNMPDCWISEDMLTLTADIYKVYIVLYKYDCAPKSWRNPKCFDKIYDMRTYGAYNNRHVFICLTRERHYQPMIPNDYQSCEFRLPRVTLQSTRKYKLETAQTEGLGYDGVAHAWRNGKDLIPAVTGYGEYRVDGQKERLRDEEVGELFELDPPPKTLKRKYWGYPSSDPGSSKRSRFEVDATPPAGSVTEGVQALNRRLFPSSAGVTVIPETQRTPGNNMEHEIIMAGSSSPHSTPKLPRSGQGRPRSPTPADSAASEEGDENEDDGPLPLARPPNRKPFSDRDIVRLYNSANHGLLVRAEVAYYKDHLLPQIQAKEAAKKAANEQQANSSSHERHHATSQPKTPERESSRQSKQPDSLFVSPASRRSEKLREIEERLRRQVSEEWEREQHAAAERKRIQEENASEAHRLQQAQKTRIELWGPPSEDQETREQRRRWIVNQHARTMFRLREQLDRRDRGVLQRLAGQRYLRPEDLESDSDDEQDRRDSFERDPALSTGRTERTSQIGVDPHAPSSGPRGLLGRTAAGRDDVDIDPSFPSELPLGSHPSRSSGYWDRMEVEEEESDSEPEPPYDPAIHDYDVDWWTAYIQRRHTPRYPPPYIRAMWVIRDELAAPEIYEIIEEALPFEQDLVFPPELQEPLRPDDRDQALAVVDYLLRHGKAQLQWAREWYIEA
ncbi:hypothetical protein B0T19DRAFT_487895 [Cercophora scortea]|uniref:Uncharacterized protein n=1 Tax=Cercophora scortea TaxID=314031 RepID=A0AAE0I782_9PEZI|nr:hypothetical protein B0T19DRAFT_487895 [Cercophora scortea]